jgi:hypothetical protein
LFSEDILLRSSRLLRAIFALAAGTAGLALAACGGSGASNGISTLPQSSQAIAPSAQLPSSSSSIAVSSQDRMLPRIIGTAHLFVSTNVKVTTDSGVRAHPYSIVYPADLQYYGGKVLKSARIYNAFVDSSSSAFGSPNTFEEHLSYSSMMHLTDQYVGTNGGNRYDWAGNRTLSYPAYATLGDNDIAAIVHAVARAIGPNAGVRNIYNIFLPKGLNYCGTGAFVPAGECNASSTSPNPYFCAFHAAVVYSDVGEVLFTLQPYQDPLYCAVNARDPSAVTPNGVQNDSTYSTLSHETFETITDPEPGTGWYDANAPAVSGEVADLCAYLAEDVNLDGKMYYIQREYSNAVHGCTD